MSEVEPTALSGILKRFYGEVRGKQGSDLSPSSLVGIRAGLQRHLSGMRSDGMDITKDPAFSAANKVFKAKCRLYSLTLARTRCFATFARAGGGGGGLVRPPLAIGP